MFSTLIRVDRRMEIRLFSAREDVYYSGLNTRLILIILGQGILLILQCKLIRRLAGLKTT